MKFKGSIVGLSAKVTASGDASRRVILELHEEEAGAFASLDFLLKESLDIEIVPEAKN
jgi:hypothetical protein